MLSTIKKIQTLNEIFNINKGIVSVYSEPDFQFEHDIVKFYILYKNGLDTVRLFHQLFNVYGDTFRVYTTTSYHNKMLEGKKLIWSKGDWTI